MELSRDIVVTYHKTTLSNVQPTKHPADTDMRGHAEVNKGLVVKQHYSSPDKASRRLSRKT